MKNIFLLISSLLIGLFLIEAGLRIFTAFPINSTSNRVYDSALGYRFSTDFEDIDENGFRNKISKVYRIAAVGDSHTYGINVEAAKSWPSQLESMLDIGVYNFGVGSYGIFSYHAIIKTLLRPETEGVIVGLFLANDFSIDWSYCQIDYDKNPFWKKEIRLLALQLPQVKNCKERQLRQRIKHIDNVDDLKKWLSQNSAFLNAYCILVDSKSKSPVCKKNQRKNSGHDYYYFKEGIHPMPKRMVKKHAKTLDMGDSDIATMYENLGKLLENWTEWSKKTERKIGIVLIPSAERVVYEYFNSENKLDSIDADFVEKVRVQVEIEERVYQLFDQYEILHKNALDNTLIAFRKSLQEGKALYPQDNSHPLEDGYRAYAKTSYELWYEMNQK